MSSLVHARRSRFAPGILVVLALFVTAFLYAAAMPTANAGAGASAKDIEAGEALFNANCAYCHNSDLAPSLVGVGAAAVDFQVGTGRMPMVANVAQAPAKDIQFSQEQIDQMAAYVASLGPGPSVPSDEAVDPSLGDPAAGMELFRTNCAMCHNAVGAGGALSEGKYAPSIQNTDPTHLYEAMLTGPQAMPVFNDASITPEGKRDIIAYIAAQDDVSPGGLALGSLGPVAEAVWVWILGIGSLIAISVWVGAKSS